MSISKLDELVKRQGTSEAMRTYTTFAHAYVAKHRIQYNAAFEEGQTLQFYKTMNTVWTRYVTRKLETMVPFQRRAPGW
jgi:hypothetical protein